MPKIDEKDRTATLEKEILDLRRQLAELSVRSSQQSETLRRAEAARLQHELERERLLVELRHMRALVETISDYVAVADLRGDVLYMNPAGLRMIGREGEDYTLINVRMLVASELSVPFETILAAVKERGQWSGERYFRHSAGHAIPIWQVVTTIRDEAGTLVGLGSIARDITVQKRAEAEREQLIVQLKRAKEESEAAGRAKSEFFAKMSHELRTPLNAILGFTQLLSQEPSLSEAQQQHLKTIVQNGEVLLLLINNLLRVSRGEATLADAIPASPATAEAPRPTLSSLALDALPAAWVEALRQATIRLDQEQLTSLIREIQPAAPGLAAELKELAGQFQFEKILGILAPGASQTGRD